MGSAESHFNVSVGSDGQSHKTVSTNHNLSEENGEPKRYRTEVLPLTSLTPYRWAQPAHKSYGAFTVLLVRKHFGGRAMTASMDSCAEIKTAPSAAYKPIPVEFGGRCRKTMLGVSDKWFPSKAWSGSEYSHAFFAHCRKFLPCPNSLPSQPIHLFIFQLRWLWLSQFHVLVHGKKIGHSDRRHNRLMQVSVLIECTCNHKQAPNHVQLYCNSESDMCLRFYRFFPPPLNPHCAY